MENTKTDQENTLLDENEELNLDIDQSADINSEDINEISDISFDLSDETNAEFSAENSENQKTPLEGTSNEVKNIEIDDANTTNSFALTIQKDHKLVAVKNVFLHSLRVTWKVMVSTAILTLLKIFS